MVLPQADLPVATAVPMPSARRRVAARHLGGAAGTSRPAEHRVDVMGLGNRALQTVPPEGAANAPLGVPISIRKLGVEANRTSVRRLGPSPVAASTIVYRRCRNSSRGRLFESPRGSPPVRHPAAWKHEMLRSTRRPGKTGPGWWLDPLGPGDRGLSLRDGRPAGRGDDRPGKAGRGRVWWGAGRIESALSSRPNVIPPVPEGSGGPPGEDPGLLGEGRRRRAAAVPGSPGRLWPGPVGGYRWPGGTAVRGGPPESSRTVLRVHIYISRLPRPLIRPLEHPPDRAGPGVAESADWGELLC